MKFAALIWAGIRRNRGRSNLILLQVVIASTYRFQFGATWQKPDQQVPVLATDVDSFLSVFSEMRVTSAAYQAM